MAQRIDLVVLNSVGPVGQVDHPDVEPVGVAVSDGPVDAGNDLRDVDGSGAVSYLDRDDAGAWSDAREARHGVVASDDAGQVCPVAVVVTERQVGVASLEREIDESDDGTFTAECGDRGYASVDDRHMDAFAGQALCPQVVGADLAGDGCQRTWTAVDCGSLVLPCVVLRLGCGR